MEDVNEKEGKIKQKKEQETAENAFNLVNR